MIVADDTPSSSYNEVNATLFPNVRHYRMPERTGWFAGRALAISQVKTEFFVWVDDDFTFTYATELEYLLKVIEETDYDVIGGAVNGRETPWNRHNRFVIDRSDNGNCFNRIIGKTIPLPGYATDCHVADVVQNFFIARTQTAGSVRMDPQFDQKAHREWFIDAIGKLRIARYLSI